LYAPFGEITNEHNSSFGNGVIPKYSFNAKELDEETGMYYYEARYMAPPVFISRDPLFEKYPTISPYTYCANNPVKYVDPTGEEFGDYYDLKGNYLGWDGRWDDNVYIVKDDFVNKNSNGTIKTDEMNPLLKTTYKTLETICTVFYKAWTNGGKNEEPAVVVEGLLSIYGKTGGVGSDGKDECYLPPVPEPLKGFRITSIHSHPFKLNTDNVFEKPAYHVVEPSDDDINTFRNQDINIIIGYVYKPKKNSEAYPNSSEKIGAVFYNANSVEIMRMRMHSIFKIIGNRARAKQNRFNMFIKNHLKQ
jgi:RHS repeat-associated protein